MKRVWLILVAGLVAGGASYVGFYRLTLEVHGVHHHYPVPELAWLKAQFHVPDTNFEAVAKLHEQYQPTCREMCRRIDEKNAELREALARHQEFHPEIERLLREQAELRVACESNMIRYFYAISRYMPEADRQRYLHWVHEQTCLSGTVASSDVAQRGGQAHGDE